MEEMTIAEMAREMLKCKNDSWYFITHYCYSLDNEREIKSLFPEWPYLKQLNDDLNSGKHVIVKKTRRLMVTWFIMAWELHSLQFKDTWPGFNMSRKEELVDDGGEASTVNSLHGKIKFIYANLPEWLKMGLTFSHLKIRCAANDSYIIGESANQDSGRGGGYAFGFIDEAAFLDNGEKSFAAFSRACKQACMVSTSNGPATMFARVYKMAQGETSKWIWRFYHALLRPDRNQDYLDRAKLELSPTDFAREEEGNDEGAQQGRVYPMFSYEAHVVENLYNPNLPLEASFDFGWNDPTAVKFFQRNGDEAYLVDETSGANKTPEEMTWKCIGILKRLGVLRDGQDPGDVLPTIRAYGDPAGNARQQDGGLSLIEQYSGLFPKNGVGRGIQIETKSISNVSFGIQEVARRLNKKKLYIDRNCVDTIDELQGYHYKVNERTGEVMSGEKPAHDSYSHGADAIRYWCENNPLPHEGIFTDKKKEPRKSMVRFKSGIRSLLRA